MEDRETPRMRKYGEIKTTRIIMATVPLVTSVSELRKFQVDGFLFDIVYNVTWRRVRSTTVTVGKEQVLHIPSVYL